MGVKGIANGGSREGVKIAAKSYWAKKRVFDVEFGKSLKIYETVSLLYLWHNFIILCPWIVDISTHVFYDPGLVPMPNLNYIALLPEGNMWTWIFHKINFDKWKSGSC